MGNLTTKQFFNQEAVQNKFKEILGDKAPGFISSVLQVTTQNRLLAKASPESIYASAMMGATLDLPINQNLGFAWIVPYGNQAQFQMGWKGFVQLAQRTGQYENINVIPVYENQFNSFNVLTEELDADFSLEPSGNVVGYCAYFKLLNGFTKTAFWSREKAEAHGKKYSKSFNSGPWKTDFDAMAMKTVLKNTLSKWGILSIEMQKAHQVDQAVIQEVDGDLTGMTIEVDYVDNDETSSTKMIQSPDDAEFEQIKNGVALGTMTFDQAKSNYDLTDKQIKTLKSVLPK